MTDDEEGSSSSSWFAAWELQLPSPQDLMPLSQSLITPPLAIAFDIPTTEPSATGLVFDDEPARALKRPRLVWTPQLHKRFVDAVAHLGINKSVPKAIMQLMNVEGLTRENVASHLQKYRLYLRRMQGLGGSARGPVSAADAAADRLFASTAVPPQFLRQGQAGSIAAAMQHHQQQQIATPPQYCQQRNLGHYGLPNGASGGGFDRFLNRAVTQPEMHRLAGMGLAQMPQMPANYTAASYLDGMEVGRREGEDDGSCKKVLTLFPTGED